MKDVTLGKMVNLEQVKSLYIPNDWVQQFNEEHHKYAIFLKNNPTMFRFVPTKTKKVVQFHMKLAVLEEDFLQRLFRIFEQMNKDYKIKPLYSSGVCFVSEECYYFFLIESVTTDIELKINEELQKLESVEEVITKTYQL